jgi:ABC-type arginine transport system permease subunit
MRGSWGSNTAFGVKRVSRFGATPLPTKPSPARTRISLHWKILRALPRLLVLSLIFFLN